GTVCVVGKMRDLILQLSKSSIYSTKPFTGSKLTIICSLMTTLKTCIRTITYLSDIGCLEIQGASL
ncbi:hypothetical protein LP785_11395, partial [Escherichia coli]|nr:hypothetical protein [Escherichia coli]